MFCVSLACFPFATAGFKSRVKYFSIVDPVEMTYYISEILDAGQQGPLFMVSFWPLAYAPSIFLQCLA
jgi:hypothetical protein